MDGELGVVLSTHRLRWGSHLVKASPAIIGLPITVLALASKPINITMLAVGLVLLALAAWFAIGAARDHECWIVHEHGLAWRCGTKTKQWTWDRVHAALEIGLRGQTEGAVLWLDGRTKSFKSTYVDNVDGLAIKIGMRVEDTQLAAYLERIEARVPIRLERNTIDADGITRLRTQVAWRDAKLGPLGDSFSIDGPNGSLRIGGSRDPSLRLQYRICEAMIAKSRAA